MSRIIFWTTVVFCTGFLALPLLLVWPLAFNTSSFLTYPIEGLTLDWFQQVLTQPTWVNAFVNSVKVAVGAMMLAVVIGGLAATGVMLMPRVMQVVLTGLFVSPIIVPTVVVGVAFAYAFGRAGIGGGYFSLVLAHAVLGSPLVFLSVITSLRGLDPNLDLAGASMGASRSYRFFTIILPLALPGYAAGALFAFVTSFDEVVVALFLADPGSTTLPIALFAGLRDRLQPSIVVVAVLLSMMSLVFLALLRRLQARGVTSKT